MKIKIGLLFILLALLAGCNYPTGESESPPAEEQAPAAETEAPTEEPTAAPPTSTYTPEPSATPTETYTPEPQPPYVRTNADESFCYFGPGKEYSIEGKISGEEFVAVLGRDDFSQWVQIAHPTRERFNCWLPVDSVELQGDVIMAPFVPAPAPFVAYVSVDMSPDSRSLTCGTYTFKVNFSISVTGPTTVEFRRYLPGNPAGSIEKFTFTEAGIQTFTDSVTRGSSGTYTYKVEVVSPNSQIGEDSSELKCK